MSTKALREAVERMRFDSIDGEERQLYHEARAELAAIEQAAKDLDRLDIGDFVYSVRQRGATMRWAEREGKDSWESPDVKAWSDASVLLASIAKGAK